MLILVEGCDGVGKTTLIEHLQAYEDTNVTTYHRGQPDRHPLEEYEHSLDWYAPGVVTVLCDRWHWGELIYGPLYRGRSLLGTAGLWHIDSYLASRGGLMVYLDVSDDEKLVRTLDERGETYLKPEHTRRVLDDYRKISRCSIAPQMRVTDYAWSVERIIETAKILEQRAMDLVEFMTYVGPRVPRYLLLGDERRIRPDRPEFMAAFVPYADTSGCYLIDGIWPQRWRSAVGLANASEEDVNALWQTLGTPSVVTLGRNAHEVTAKAGVPHGAVPHPQYIRRFHNKARDGYIELIYRALQDKGEYLQWPRSIT